ncbi:hypothetical protein DL770_004607 [Monosporascus sp. CRB-9-2]|nr:hypothetical protein DL770_004607 [Monosporascus sp. CRB-9-2]
MAVTGDVVINYETCERCKASRKAEEAVQQHIYQQSPLYFNITHKGAIRQSYWASLKLRKEEAEQAKLQKAAGKSSLGDVEDLAPAPKLMTMRHQSNTP